MPASGAPPNHCTQADAPGSHQICIRKVAASLASVSTLLLGGRDGDCV